MTPKLEDRLKNWEALAHEAGYSSGQVAKLLGVSGRHLRRLSRKLFDRPLQAMLDEKQLQDARKALAEAYRVKEVAHHFNYKHPGSFSHWFKAKQKVSPSQFSSHTG
jgi:AraC-like DNA-binding protein